MRQRLRIIVVILLPVILAGSARAQSTLEPAGPAARTISRLSWIVYLIFIAVSLILWGLIWWVARRRRGTFDEHEPPDAGGGQSWILIGGLAIPSAILAVIFILGLRTMSQFPLHDGEAVAPEIRLIGHQWWWEVQYVGGAPDNHFATANEIHIPAGRMVNLELSSADVIHSFWVPNLSGKVDLVPGHPNRMRLKADLPGRYNGKCAEFCGAQHARMMIVVVAQPADEYETWRAHQLEAASNPTTAQEIRGRDLFMAGPCAFCHTVRGTPAHGNVAPDLTHLATRRGLAANAYTNNKANLAAWVTHAQALKPASEMPNLTQFSGEELQALVAYLQQLR